jgi:hypothetical protein
VLFVNIIRVGSATDLFSTFDWQAICFGLGIYTGTRRTRGTTRRLTLFVRVNVNIS